NLAVDVLHGMVNHLMRIIPFEAIVEKQSISIERCASFDMLLDFRLKRLFLAIRNHDSAHLPATLQDAHDSGFVFSASPGNPALALCDVHVAGLASDEGFVGFHFAGEFLGRLTMKGKANAVHHMPCRLLRYAKVAAHFVAADAVLAIHDQPNGGYPL